MKSRAFFVGCFLLASGVIAAAPQPAGAIEARQAPSCGEWVANREKAGALALGNASWLLGYLSGLSISSGRDFLTGTDNTSLYKWMDHYCRANPLRDLSSGGQMLAIELGRKKQAPK